MQFFCLIPFTSFHQGFLGVLEGKESAYKAGDPGSMPESGRSPGEGNGGPLQSSCLGNPMEGGAWEAAVHGVTKSWTRLSDFPFLSFHFPFPSHDLQSLYML